MTVQKGSVYTAFRKKNHLHYRVEAAKQGFRSALRERAEVGVSETARLDFQLVVGSVGDNVTVSAQAAAVETEQGRVSGRIDRTQLNDYGTTGNN